MSHAIIERSRRGHRHLAWLGGLVLVSACADSSEGPGGSSTGGPESSPLPGTAALISAPTAVAVSAAATMVIGRAYVSMAPGTAPGGDSVTIEHLGGGPSVGTRMVDGGFDPIAVEAEAGDTLAISVLHETGATDTTYGVVPIKGRPVIVRTSPAIGRTDVPLNSVIEVVFNEPMDSLSLSDALHLQLHGVDVPGTVTGILVGGVILGGEFVPTSPLEPASPYQLSVSTAARDLSGTPLSSPVQLTFTTAGTTAGPTPPDTAKPNPPDPPATEIVIWAPPSSIGVGETALLQAWANGAHIGRIRPTGPIVWSNTDESTAAVVPFDNPDGYPNVDYFANLHGIAEGVVTVSAAADGITANIAITVGKPATSITVSPEIATISAARCEAVQLGAMLRDATGTPLDGRRPVWSSSSPSAYVDQITGVVYAEDSGAARITASTGLVAASTTITVVGHVPVVPGTHLPLCD